MQTLIAWALTLIGPVLFAVRGWLPGAGLVRVLKAAAWVASLVMVAAGSVAAANWWHSDKITLAESNQRCADAISIATVKAKEDAIALREFNLRHREEMVAIDEAAVAAAVTRMERDREEAARAGSDGVLVRADDEWLQRYRARHGLAGSRR